MKGTRIPLDAEGKPTRWPSAPGEYVGPLYGYTADKPAVFFLKPNARDIGAPAVARAVQHVTSPPHTFTEEDGQPHYDAAASRRRGRNRRRLARLLHAR